jgi:GNAT superfamily N-acetyltransferase
MRASLGEGAIPRTRAFWEWKHCENPFGASPYWVAEAEGRIVGFRAFMHWRWRVGGRELSAVRAVDTATHPDWQGRGIFSQLTLCLLDQVRREGVQFVFNTPNEKSRPGYLKMGWQVVGRLPLWVRPRLVRLARAGGRRMKGGVVRASTNVRQPAPIDLDVLRSDKVRQLLQSQADVRLQTPVSPEYFEWRYARCPALQYGLAGSDPSRSFLIYRLKHRHELVELAICDFFFEPSWRGLRAARRAVVDLCDSTDADYVVSSYRGGAGESAVLGACGFLPVPSAGPVLTFRAVGERSLVPDPRKPATWGASVGDLELF